MKKMPQITEAEYEVMQIIWHNYPISTNEITEQLLQTTNWNPRTIQTLIKRLATKILLPMRSRTCLCLYATVKERGLCQSAKQVFLGQIFQRESFLYGLNLFGSSKFIKGRNR